MVMEDSKRIEWLDMLGGVAVLSVFVQHSMTPKITRLILAVHMPLFFFVAGFLYKSKKEKEFPVRKYIHKKYKHILVPWFLWFLIDGVITAMIGLMNQQFVWERFLSSYWDSLIYFNILWFLPCFFLAECAFHLIHQLGIFRQKETCWVDMSFMLLFFLLSWLENRLASERLLFQLDTCLMALGLLFWGSLFQSIFMSWKPKPLTSLLVGLATGVAGTGFVLLNGESTFMMVSNEYGNYLYALLAAFLLTMSLIHLLWWTPWLPRRYLIFLRQNSLLLFPFHVELLRIVNLVLPDRIQNNLWIYSSVCLLIIHITMFPACWLVNRYVPILGGKHKNARSFGW